MLQRFYVEVESSGDSFLRNPTRDRSSRGKYLLLDGHLRLEALKDMGVVEVVCLVSTDDEAFTYNKPVSRLAIVQEHKIILKANRVR